MARTKPQSTNTRPALQEIDLMTGCPRLKPTKQKPSLKTKGSAAPSQTKVRTSTKENQPAVAPRDGLTEGGRAWKLQIEEEKRRHEHRQALALKRQQEAEKRQKIAELEADGLSPEEIAEILADPEAEGSFEEDAELGPQLEDEFTLQNTTISSNKRKRSLTHLERTSQSSPIPSRISARPVVPSQSSLGPHAHAISRRYGPDDNASEDEDAVSSSANHKRARIISEPLEHANIEDKDQPSDDADVDAETHTQNTRKSCDGSGKPKAADYDDITQSVLTMAITEFQVRVCTRYAFPEEHKTAEVEEWVRECWDNACENKGHSVALTPRLQHLISTRVSTIRGRVREKVVAKLNSHYNFKSGAKPATVERNKNLAKKLLEEDNYIFADLDDVSGMYEHPILQDVINDQWFGNKKGDGITFGTYFNPISDATIALVFTAVEYAVSQWTSGQLVKRGHFTEATYHDVYKRHLNNLEAWRGYSDKTAQALARNQQRLHDHGRANAGLPATVTTSAPRFNAAKLARAAQAIRDDSDDD